MCGIIGYIGHRPAKDFLIEGLKRLEYRGYDSAGIAFIAKGKIQTIKAVGKVVELENKVVKDSAVPTIGIAHTRWATHGKPSEKNAHPHTDCSKTIAVVHNGIIENHLSLKEQLIKDGHHFRSDTDTEVVAHLIEQEMKNGSHIFEEAFSRALSQLKGTYGIAVIHKDEPEKLLVARMGSPLVLGVGTDEYWVASDVSAILAHTKRVVYLEDGEQAVVTSDGYVVKSGGKIHVKKDETEIDWSDSEAKRGGYPHFMLKEIFDQPKSFADALRGRLVLEEGLARLGGLRKVEKRLRSINRIIIVSCGTSYHSGLVGEYMLEEYAGIPTEVEMASEFRYRKPLLDERTAVIAISQSGETADTLAAIREAKEKGSLTLGIVNVVASTIARETDAGVYCHAGPEISVASTKAFTSQLGILALLTVYLGRQREMSLVMGKRITKELLFIPKHIETVLEQMKDIKRLAKKYSKQSHYMYLGRKYNFPLALEGALKIKEIAYVPAQGYPTGEMKHGPIALVDSSVLSLMIIPEDSVYEKNMSGMEELLARGCKVLAIATQGNTAVAKKATDVVYIPKTLEMFTPLLAVILLQLFAYFVAVERGYDIDKPRNLAKSVTVE